MDVTEFEKEYAARSGVSVEFLHSEERYAEPCDCEDEICKGWQMVNRKERAIIEAVELLYREWPGILVPPGSFLEDVLNAEIIG